MKTVISKSEASIKNNLKADAKIKLPKIILGKGRNMAEIDYDAVFDNVIKK